MIIQKHLEFYFNFVDELAVNDNGEINDLNEVNVGM